MKKQEKFLRTYRKWPRRDFAQALYQRISHQKDPTALLVWGLVGILLAVGLSSNVLNVDLLETYQPHVVEEQDIAIIRRAPNPAMIAERGLKAAEVHFPPPNVERLGPFDKPAPKPVVEESHLAMVVITIAERR